MVLLLLVLGLLPGGVRPRRQLRCLAHGDDFAFTGAAHQLAPVRRGLADNIAGRYRLRRAPAGGGRKTAVPVV